MCLSPGGLCIVWHVAPPVSIDPNENATVCRSDVFPSIPLAKAFTLWHVAPPVSIVLAETRPARHDGGVTLVLPWALVQPVDITNARFPTMSGRSCVCGWTLRRRPWVLAADTVAAVFALVAVSAAEGTLTHKISARPHMAAGAARHLRRCHLPRSRCIIILPIHSATWGTTAFPRHLSLSTLAGIP